MRDSLNLFHRGLFKVAVRWIPSLNPFIANATFICRRPWGEPALSHTLILDYFNYIGLSLTFYFACIISHIINCSAIAALARLIAAVAPFAFLGSATSSAENNLFATIDLVLASRR